MDIVQPATVQLRQIASDNPSTNYATRPMPVIAFSRPHAVHCRCRLALVTNNTSPCSRPEFFVH